MDRARIWPNFRDAWVLYEDEDLLAVDKPEGVSSQAADPDNPDDLVTRLKRYLAARSGSKATEHPYVGVHQRLDRDTSGVLVFARRREANAGLAAQFEGRRVRKTYVACVTTGEGGKASQAFRAGARLTLRDVLAPDRDGRMRVVEGGRRGGGRRGERAPPPRQAPTGAAAVTHARVLTRRGNRALVELELETGRTHQARVQLAHAGAPIGGDVEYGGAAAPRLLLHARALDLAHPATRKPMRFEAPLPPEFEAWVERGDPGPAVYRDPGALARALDRALERRWALGRSEGTPHATTAFRLVNEDGDGLPRLAVDVYDRWLVAQLYPGSEGDGRGAADPWADAASREALLDHLGALGFDGVYLKVRPRQANLLVDTRREELAPALPVRGTAAPENLVVLEEGMPLVVRLGDGLSTGVFLDQRANRRRVRELARGAAVANLFAYTCAFSLAAALGGAVRTVSVDASAAALERGRVNMERAGVSPLDAHAFVAEDAFTWLARAERRGERFDLVVLDPPSYSSTKRGRFVADSDYAGLAAAALGILTPGGKLLACTNHRGISPGRFRRILFDAARTAGREVAQIKDLAEPPDFPVPPGGAPHMKSALLTLGAPPTRPSTRRA